MSHWLLLLYNGIIFEIFTFVIQKINIIDKKMTHTNRN